ncbi:hypothetical protein BDZ45DRAFT_602478, partial [Acephala macrosclerotiorum]
AKIMPSINSTLERGMTTECEACPYSLCTNKAFYDYGTIVRLVCWTHGAKIENDRTWLQTTDACYVTQDNLEAYNGTYETDLTYYGKDSEELHLTLDTAVVKYDTECNLCPDVGDCANVKYLSPDRNNSGVLNRTWLKTSDNCYVAEVGLHQPADRDILDNCGPIGFIQASYTGTKRDTSSSPEPITLPSSEAPPQIGTDLKSHYLVNITVGEDYAFCHSRANSTCDVVGRYLYKHEVRPNAMWRMWLR